MRCLPPRSTAIRPAPARVSATAVERFAQAMRTRLSTDEIPFRKAYIRSIVDRIEVDDRCIRIMGRKGVLEQAVLAEGGIRPGVHTIVPSWRPREDSNLRPSD
jgi:site-specific DNA recombinase